MTHLVLQNVEDIFEQDAAIIPSRGPVLRSSTSGRNLTVPSARCSTCTVDVLTPRTTNVCHHTIAALTHPEATMSSSVACRGVPCVGTGRRPAAIAADGRTCAPRSLLLR